MTWFISANLNTASDDVHAKLIALNSQVVAQNADAGEQFTAAVNAVELLVKQLEFGSEIVVSLSGHRNPTDFPAYGSASDSVTISVCAIPGHATVAQEDGDHDAPGVG